MPKRRKTRQEKIILQLKRELTHQQAAKPAFEAKSEISQEAILKSEPKQPQTDKSSKNTDKSVFFYDPKLVKKDLIKSLILTLGIISLELVLYLKLN